MRLHPFQHRTVAVLALSIVMCAASPSPASANLLKPICGATKLASGLAGKACSLLSNPGKVLGTAKKLLSGHIGGAIKTAFGETTGSPATTVLGLAAIGTWVVVGAKAAMSGIAKVLGQTTDPLLTATWFSSTYWRMAGIAALLTIPFLCAAAVQALLRSDLSLLGRAALGYLPLAMLAVGIAAPLAMLLLAASDQMSAIISSAAGNDGGRFLARAGAAGGFLSLFGGSPFLAFLVGLLAAAAAIVLWLELLAREAAVYVVVLMLPLAFAAMVWPARRVWAIRAVEMLVALILSKFAIVAVLSLGAAALGHLSSVGIAGAMSGTVLVLLAAFAPWALLRLLPLSELAAGVAGPLRGEARSALNSGHQGASAWAGESSGWAKELTARMRGQAGRDAESDPLNSGERRGAESEAARLDELAGGYGGGAPLAVGAGSGASAPHNGTSGFVEGSGGGSGSGGLGSGGLGSGGAAAAGPGSGASGSGGSAAGGDPAGGEGSGDFGESPPYTGRRWQTLDNADARAGRRPAGSPFNPYWPPDGRVWQVGATASHPSGGAESDPSTDTQSAAAEDHDPLPPRQDPEDGLL